MTLAIRRLGPDDARALHGQLCGVLSEVVDAGGSLGFTAPLMAGEASAYWERVADDLASGAAVMLVGEHAGLVVGSVQLHPSPWPDGRHRAELAKLMIAPRWRRRGYGTLLLEAIEDVARRQRRWLLILNTRLGDPVERIYARRGYRRFGVVPDYVCLDDTFHDKAYWYRDLRS